MKYIEDYVSLFASYTIRLNNFDERIAMSLAEQCLRDKPFTAKQADIALRLLRKYKGQFLAQGHTNLPNALDIPVYKHSFRTIDHQKSVSIDTAEKRFVIKFPFDQDLVTKIRAFNAKNETFKGLWDSDNKFWALDYNESSIKFILDELVPRNFTMSDEIREFCNQYEDITNNFDQYIPMLIKDNDSYTFKNVKSDFATDDLMTALVQAAKFSVNVHDDVIAQELELMLYHKPLAKVFTTQDSQNFQMSKNDYTRSQLVSFAKDMDCMTAIFLEENASADTLQMWVEALKSIGVNLDDVGVFCRRKNDQEGIRFNTIVKEYGLNKTATDDVKWVFLMTKYPKSLVKSDKVPEVCLFDNKYVNVHHTVKSIVKNSVFNFLHNDHVSKGSEFVIL